MECKVRDLNVHYRDIGTGHPLLVLHGSPGNGDMMVAVSEPFFEARTGWRRLYPDFLDFGEPSAPDWMRSPDDIADVLVAFMDTVAPGEHFAVASWSMGAYLARGIVQRRSQQIDGVLFVVPLMEFGITDLPVHQIIHSDPAFLAALQPSEEWLKGVFVGQSRAALDTFRAVALAHWVEPNPAILEISTKPYVSSPDVLLEPCPAPTLFITGRQDHIVGYKQAWSILENFPRATFAVLDRAGHGLWSDEQPTLYLALVNEWLDRVEEYISASVAS